FGRFHLRLVAREHADEIEAEALVAPDDLRELLGEAAGADDEDAPREAGRLAERAVHHAPRGDERGRDCDGAEVHAAAEREAWNQVVDDEEDDAPQRQRTEDALVDRARVLRRG